MLSLIHALLNLWWGDVIAPPHQVFTFYSQYISSGGGGDIIRLFVPWTAHKTSFQDQLRLCISTK